VASESDPPIATATVAWLYMEQGKLDQAEQLYRRLQAEDPDDPRPQRGLAEVQRRRQSQLAGSGDQLTLERCAGGLRCRWLVTEEGRARAELVLGRQGSLVLRVVAFPIDPSVPPGDTLLAGPSGEIQVQPPAGASVVGAAVGLRGESGDFVSITHTAPVALSG
jgi:hypothetical protein